MIIECMDCEASPCVINPEEQPPEACPLVAPTLKKQTPSPNPTNKQGQEIK